MSSTQQNQTFSVMVIIVGNGITKPSSNPG